ncbi:toxin glutamine deamidase domain-containing protein [Kitasatospora sp. NPDC085895]|uniref:toxin glutamine deamidase domain-containing protein n=1 Tax=Kitasatospora sp. NPDC085895 TaxID=3155057 RepID=UPI00344DABC7
METASTAVADAPPTHTPTAGPDATSGQPGPSGQNAGTPTATGPIATGPVPGAGVPGSGSPSGGTPPRQGGPVPHPGHGGDGPSTNRPTTVPGQSTGRPDHGDRPTGLGRRPGTERPGTDRPAAIPRPDADRPSRPDPRTADPRSADPRTADQRPSTDRPTGAAPRPAADRPAADRPGDDGPARTPDTARPDHGSDTRPEDHGKSEDHGKADERQDHDRPEGGDSHTDQDGRPDADTPPHERPLSDSRPYDTPGGLARVEEHHQQELERRIPRNPDGTPQRHPDPYGDWPGAVNGDGHREPGRDNNCLDVALSSADTYSGNPSAAAARTDDGSPDGERGGRDRAERQLGAPFRDLGNGDQAFHRLEDTLRQSGHGSQAVIVTQDAHGRAHAWNVVNHNGKIVYLDNQTGARSDKPIHNGDHGVFAIPLDADRRPITSDHRPSDDGSHAGPDSHAGSTGPGRDGNSTTRSDHSDRPDRADRAGDPDRDGDSADRRPADPAGKTKHDADGTESDAEAGPPKKKQKPSPDNMEVDSGHGHTPGAGTSHDGTTPHDETMADAGTPDAGTPDDRQGSTPYHDAQPKDHTHYNMLGDDEQQTFRGRENAKVRQSDLDIAHDFLRDRFNDKSLGDLLQDTADQARHNKDTKDDPNADFQLAFDKDELERRLPGFKDLHQSEQGAVVAGLGRLSLSYHQQYAVGSSPEHASDPYHYRDDHDRSDMSETEAEKQQNDKHHEDDQSRGVATHQNHDFWQGPRGNEHRPLKEGETPQGPSPARLVREHMVERYRELHPDKAHLTDRQVELAIRRETIAHVKGDHRPDFTGKNYAAIEVVDGDGKVRYVVDSSLPPGKAGMQPEHSEPHLGRWIERLNQRAEAGDYTVASLWTEREPCGQGAGHGHCSRYLTESLPDTEVGYGVGYRKGDMADGHDTDAERETAAAKMEQDMQDHLNRLGDLWYDMAVSGELNRDRTPNQHVPQQQ